MDTVTHALAPVIIAHVVLSRSKSFGAWSLVAIGAAGALPDLLTPHLTLESRMTSWSHGLPFWAAFTGILFVISLLSKQRLPYTLSLVLSLSYLFVRWHQCVVSRERFYLGCLLGQPHALDSLGHHFPTHVLLFISLPSSNG